MITNEIFGKGQQELEAVVKEKLQEKKQVQDRKTAGCWICRNDYCYWAS